MRGPLEVLDSLCASLGTGQATAPGDLAASSARDTIQHLSEPASWKKIQRDPLEVLDALCATLAVEEAHFPGVLADVPDRDAARQFEKIDFSRFSRLSRRTEEEAGQDRRPDTIDARSQVPGSHARGPSPQMPGNPGNPGKPFETPLLPPLQGFPVDFDGSGNSGKEGSEPVRTAVTSAGDDPGQASLPVGHPAPFSPDDVRAGVDREVRGLMAYGRTGPDVLRDALEIVRAKIRNAAGLVERQVMSNRCHACGEGLDKDRLCVSVLQTRPGHPLHMHAGACHDAYRCRRAELVEGIMASAGYPARPADATSDIHSGSPAHPLAGLLGATALADRPFQSAHDIPDTDDA